MAGAITKVHWQHGFFINWELTAGRGHGFEANMAFIAMALACVIAGPCPPLAGRVAGAMTRTTKKS